MDCKEFLDKHSLYVDLMCSALEENEMREHARRCAKCSRHDMLVRRSLLLVRNLPTIEPSVGFRERLNERLRSSAPVETRRIRYRPRLRHYAVAAGLAFLGVLAATVRTRPTDPVRLAPVVATLPDVEPSHAGTPAFVATIPNGMSVWPAIMVASQAQMHFVAAELASER